jgi:hypothetical protein
LINFNAFANLNQKEEKNAIHTCFNFPVPSQYKFLRQRNTDANTKKGETNAS